MTIMKKATKQQSKQHNSRLVLRTLYQEEEMSRADISRATKLTRPTVSSIVSDLIEDDLVLETGLGVSAGGKRPLLLQIAYDAHQLISIDLGSHEFRGALSNLNGDITIRRTIIAESKKAKDALQLVFDLIDDLFEQATAPILGIGIGAPGVVNQKSGIIRQAINLDWHDLPIRNVLIARYNCPVYVANDSHMAALAEYTFGEQYDSRNLIVIKASRGVGAGILLNGRPFYGDGYGAGEIGHVVVVEDGELCRCGNTGCLETVSSSTAILNKARQSTPDADWAWVMGALQDGDAGITQIIADAGKYLGITIATLIGNFSIHHIVVAGRVATIGQPLVVAMEQEISRRILPSLAADIKVTLSTAGTDIVLLGSAAMVLQHELGII